MDVSRQCRVIERELERFRSQLRSLVCDDWPVDVRIVVRHFHTHLFDSDLQVGDACRECGIHDGRFRQVFKRHCQQTMHQYYEDKRLLAPLRLLSFAGLEIGAIAVGIGYENYRTFGRAVRRRFEESPEAIRARMLRHDCVNGASLPVDTDLPALGKKLRTLERE